MESARLETNKTEFSLLIGICRVSKCPAILKPQEVMTFDHDSNCVIPEENLRKAEWATAMIGATLFIIFSKGKCMYIFDHEIIDNLNIQP